MGRRTWSRCPVVEIVLQSKARVVEIGDDGSGRPCITLGFEDGEVLFPSKIEDCRLAARALCTDVSVVLTFKVASHG